MRVLICPDSFKGSLSAAEAAAAIARGMTAARAEISVRTFAVADGGEGTLAALCTPEQCRQAVVSDPFGRPIPASFGLLDSGIAVIESAQAAGLTLLSEDERNPLAVSTFGVGQLIEAALMQDCRRLLITVGGTATNDGGCGMLAALGVRFLDAAGHTFVPVGGTLSEIAGIDISGFDRRLAECEITIATDVTNPLTGRFGATAVYAPQKGADAAAQEILEAGMVHLGSLIDGMVGRPISEIPGCGAGGGMPLGLLAFTSARICRGIEAVLDAIGFDEALLDADAVITGEGRTDRQSAWGKVAAGVARRAQAAGVPTYILSGSLDCDAAALDALESLGVRGVFSMLDAPCTLDDAMQNAAVLLESAAGRLARRLLTAAPIEASLRWATACLHESGASCVLVRPGEIPCLLEGSGISPLVHSLRADRKAFAGAAAADKIVGLAAAYLFVYGHAEAIYGEVMSTAADRWLTGQGIPHAAGVVVEKIINRRGDGICPMEARAIHISTPEEAWRVFDEVVK
ncbi:MAG: glycerate kinase [Clostridia bacterium]|nr:glycerate kinase [Clostridia bacterium]